MSNYQPLDFPQFALKQELDRLIAEGKLDWHGSQICINSIPSRPDSTSLGCSSLVYDWDNAVLVDKGNGNTEYEVPYRDPILTEEDFTELCTVFRGTLFEQAYEFLVERYHIGRVRLINSEPKTCMTWHTDESVRIHYPLKTQDGCMMIIDDEVKHLPEQTWWLADTRNHHTAVNGSKENRIHLVVVVLGEKNA